MYSRTSQFVDICEFQILGAYEMKIYRFQCL